MKLAVIVVVVMVVRAVLVFPVLLRRQPSNQKQLPASDENVVPEVPKAQKPAGDDIGFAKAIAAAAKLRNRA